MCNAHDTEHIIHNLHMKCNHFAIMVIFIGFSVHFEIPEQKINLSESGRDRPAKRRKEGTQNHQKQKIMILLSVKKRRNDAEFTKPYEDSKIQAGFVQKR